jgi:hypothetical protein
MVLKHNDNLYIKLKIFKGIKHPVKYKNFFGHIMTLKKIHKCHKLYWIAIWIHCY